MLVDYLTFCKCISGAKKKSLQGHALKKSDRKAIKVYLDLNEFEGLFY